MQCVGIALWYRLNSCSYRTPVLHLSLVIPSPLSFLSLFHSFLYLTVTFAVPLAVRTR